MKTSSQDIVHLSFCRLVFVYVFFLRQERVSHPTSFNTFSIETSLVAPLTIRAALCCIFLIHLPRIAYSYPTRRQHIQVTV